MSKATGSFAPNIHVTKDFYSPLQQKISNDIDKCSNWNFNYDLATPPAAAEIGLNAFGEFLEFPAYYESILKKIDKQIQSTFTK
jgi:multiple sugar transport system substrate-binding protein/raffinose/stachyose/melibiose transport system substrate-binding protein